MLLICYKTTVEKLCIKLIKVKYFKCRSVIFVEFFLGLRSTIACFQKIQKHTVLMVNFQSMKIFRRNLNKAILLAGIDGRVFPDKVSVRMVFPLV